MPMKSGAKQQPHCILHCASLYHLNINGFVDA